MSQNDKLRESLLKIAREHYRSLKTAEHLQEKVEELSQSLRKQETLTRKLHTELEEYKRAQDLSSVPGTVPTSFVRSVWCTQRTQWMCILRV